MPGSSRPALRYHPPHRFLTGSESCSEEPMFELDRNDVRRLEWQRLVGITQAFWVIPLFWFLLRVVGGYRNLEARSLRKTVRALDEELPARPLLICANHLTMIDSMLIAWAMHHPARYCIRFSLMPWNMPELKNFGKSFWLRAMCFLGRCIYVEREGSLASKRTSLAKAYYLLRRGDPLLIFPEGGRSRTGFVKESTSATGVGRLVQALPEARVLCLYLRGRSQKTYSFFPHRGERFDASAVLIEPRTALTGGQGAKDLTQQILDQLRAQEASVLGIEETSSPGDETSDSETAPARQESFASRDHRLR